MEVKKKYVMVAVSLVCLLTGMWLAQILLYELATYGFVGYLLLFLFIVSLLWVIRYELDLKEKRIIIRETAEKVISEDKKASLSMFRNDIKTDLYNHLVNKAYDEEIYHIFGKIKKSKNKPN